MTTAGQEDYVRLDPALACAWEEYTTAQDVRYPLAYAWIPDREAVVIGLSQSAERELNLETIQDEKIPIVRRSSGGGAVVFIQGVLCFGVICPPEELNDSGIHGSFRELTSHVADACLGWNIWVQVAGISDLAAAPSKSVQQEGANRHALRKIAGCAQLRKKQAILVHGSLLVSADTTRFKNYLQFPSEVPDYRLSRDHDSFCTTLEEISGQSLPLDLVAAAIRQHAEQRQWTWQLPPTTCPAQLENLYQHKYQSEDWSLRRIRPKQL